MLVFDRGLLYGYAQKHTARAIFWPDIDPGSLRTVEAPAGVAADGLLKTLNKDGKTSLGVADGSRGVPRRTHGSGGGRETVPSGHEAGLLHLQHRPDPGPAGH